MGTSLPIIKSFMVHEVAELSRQCGFLDEQKYFYFCIYEKYTELKNEGKKNEEIEVELAELFHRSESWIHRIYLKYKEDLEAKS